MTQTFHRMLSATLGIPENKSRKRSLCSVKERPFPLSAATGKKLPAV